MLSHLWSLSSQRAFQGPILRVPNHTQLYGMIILVYNVSQGMPRSKFNIVTQQWNLFLKKKHFNVDVTKRN